MPAGQGSSPHWRHGQANARPSGTTGRNGGRAGRHNLDAMSTAIAVASASGTAARSSPGTARSSNTARPQRPLRRTAPSPPHSSSASGSCSDSSSLTTQPSRPGRRRARHTKPSTVQTPVRARDPSVEQPPPRKPPQTPGRGGVIHSRGYGPRSAACARVRECRQSGAARASGLLLLICTRACVPFSCWAAVPVHTQHCCVVAKLATTGIDHGLC